MLENFRGLKITKKEVIIKSLNIHELVTDFKNIRELLNGFELEGGDRFIVDYIYGEGHQVFLGRLETEREHEAVI